MAAVPPFRKERERMGHPRLSRPSGTGFRHVRSYPALKRRAIVKRPSDDFFFPRTVCGEHFR
jgi:hypothetical protein